MNKLSREDLFPLEEYSERRDEFRRKVMAHKQQRLVRIGDHTTLYFEDRLTIQYQIQEMLRVEKIFDRAGIQEELDAYNPLIPDGGNLKATFMIEYPDVEERRQALAKLVGIEDQVWIQVAGHDRVYAIADEDLERGREDKTSSVHFLRFELPADSKAEIKNGATFDFGIDHPAYTKTADALSAETRSALSADLS